MAGGDQNGRVLDRPRLVQVGALLPVNRGGSAVEMGERHDVDDVRDRLPRLHHEGTQQFAAYLLVRDLVGVVPEGAGLVGDKYRGARSHAANTASGIDGRSTRRKT